MTDTTPIAITCGVFDLLHEGHVNLLNRAYSLVGHGRLFVMAHTDHSTFLNKSRFPVQSLSHRLANLELLPQVAGTFVTAHPNPGHDVARAISSLRTWPGHAGARVIFFRGDDWPDFPGRAVIEEAADEVLLFPYTAGVSSTMRRDEL